MKTIKIIIVICIVFGCSFCSQDFRKLNESEVDQGKIQLAQDFANSILNQWKNSSSYQFQDEAVDVIKNQFTEQNQKTSYQQTKDMFGDYQSLEYAETWEQISTSLMIIRLKADFSESSKKVEVRVVLDESNKIAGFWIKPWADMLK